MAINFATECIYPDYACICIYGLYMIITIALHEKSLRNS